MTAYPQICLRTSKLGALESGHPWVLERSIIQPTVPVPVGTVVDLVTPDGRFVGRGLYNPASRIRIRVLQWQQAQSLDENWLVDQLSCSLDLRRQIRGTGTESDAERLVNSEGDGLSGLIIDRFGQHFVIQITAACMIGWLPVISKWLNVHFHPRCILLRVDEHIARLEGMEVSDSVLEGELPTTAVSIFEHGVQIQFDIAAAQKTGYYLDQRDNRLAAARWMRGRMLDVCCYLGGFSLAAAKWGSPSNIVAIDSSRRALEQAEHNARLNSVEQIEFVEGDCFAELERLCQMNTRFNSIVLDPPKLVGSHKQKDVALRAYHKLNSQAIRLIEPRGILVSCSCSGRISREEFAHMLSIAARRSGRQIQVIEQRGAAADHPFSLSCPESEYLKCFICRVS